MPGNPFAPGPRSRRGGIYDLLPVEDQSNLQTSFRALLEFQETVGLSDLLISEAVFPNDSGELRRKSQALAQVSTARGILKSIEILVPRGQEIAVFQLKILASTPEATVKQGVPLLIFTHSQLVAWWLMINWRIKDLATSMMNLAEVNYTATVVIIRSLVETVAALLEEGETFEKHWKDFREECVKTKSFNGESWLKLRDSLIYMSASSRWSERSMPVKEWLDRVERRSAANGIDLLRRRLAGRPKRWVDETYEMLCNFAHPGQLNFVPYEGVSTSDPRLGPVSVHTSSQGGIVFENLEVSEPDPYIRPIVQLATACLTVSTDAMDRVLRLIDDISLCGGLADISPFDTWRLFKVEGRNQPCPCRSGQKVKECKHSLF